MTAIKFFLSSITVGLAICSQPSWSATVQPKIAYGDDTTIAQAPWQVALTIGTINSKGTLTNYSRFCSGTLISKQWIVSAEHCFADQKLAANQAYFAIVGQQTLTSTVPLSAFHRIDALVKRTDYNNLNYDNDISLSKLSTPLNFSNCNDCQAANWSNNDTDSNVSTPVFVAGWGATDSASSSATLQSTTLNIVNCVSKSTGASYNIGGLPLSNNTLCAQSTATPPSDTCKGDSGSGLIANYGTNKPILVGITSFSITGDGSSTTCDNSTDYPGGYTKVSNYCQWITEQTGITNHCVVSNQKTVSDSQVIDVTPSSPTTSTASSGGGGALGLGASLGLVLTALLYRRSRKHP